MKLLCALALVVSLSGIGYSQDTQTSDPSTQVPPEHGIPVADIELPPIEISLQDIVDILTDFNVVQEDGGYFCSRFYGLTDFDAKSISVCSKYDMTARRRTILHEVLHVVYWRHGVYTGGPYEWAIEKLATKLFTQFYGLTTRVSTGGNTGTTQENSGTAQPTEIIVGPATVPEQEPTEQE